mmetsp:Transcript_49979/g.118214  ORF Transcript_49979/g.118214 Transcript_49979/m.118214 type:complete len:89 (+) Transcript_49979:85-351(+)
MVRATNSVTATEDELADLQRRFHLLEGDRKAFYEASQWTIKQNKETLELVKDIFASAGERDIYTGDFVDIYVIKKDGTTYEQFPLKKD